MALRSAFFSTAPQVDNHGVGVTKAASYPGEGNKAGKPIQVMEQLEFSHPESMTGFLPVGKAVFPRNCRDFMPSQAESYPLKNAKSHKGNACGALWGFHCGQAMDRPQ